MSKTSFALVFAIACLGCSTAEICDPHIKVLDRFPDGYRAVMSVPVMTSQISWDVLVDFDKNITTLDVPDASIKDGVKSGSHFVLRNLRHNARLPAGKNLSLEFVVHFPRKVLPTPKIKQIQLGAFVCKPKSKNEIAASACAFDKPIPLCSVHSRVMSKWADGYQVAMSITVSKTVSSWTMVIIFSSKIRRLDFPRGNIISSRNGSEFMIKNKDYNGKLQNGDVFNFVMSVYHTRGENVKIEAIILDPVQFICGSRKYVEILAERYRIVTTEEEEPCEGSTERCEDNLRYIDRFPDGYRASFKLPVLDNLNGWKAYFEFDSNVTTFDVPNADIIGGVKSGRMFVLKDKRHNQRQRKGSYLDLEFTVHFPRHLKPVPKILTVEFDDYYCDSAVKSIDFKIGANWLGGCARPTTPPPPDCSAFFQRSTLWPDGEQGVIKIPITVDMSGWNVTVEYSKNISTIDVPQADKVQAKNNVHFVFRNKIHNAKIKAGVIWNLGITVHYRRGLVPRPKISLIKLGNRVVCRLP